MRQEGRGIGLHNKMRAYALQDGGLDTVEANEALGFPADRRDYGIGMQILRRPRPAARSGCSRTTRRSAPASRATACEVVERVPIQATPNAHNIRYLETKRNKLGHELEPHQDGSL